MYTIIRRNIISKDSGVSPAIAVILILALTVLFAAITGIALLSNSNINSAAPISGITITENNGIVTFTHFSGETLKAGEYKIILDSRTISGNSDFGPGNVLNYEAENINHAAIVSAAKGNEAVIAEKYFGGSGVAIRSVDVGVIGFRTSSESSDNERPMFDSGRKYKLIYSTDSKIGVIITLTGDTDYVKELKDVTVGDITHEEWDEKDSKNPYYYSIPTKNGGGVYKVSGIVSFTDETSQEFEIDNVFVPAAYDDCNITVKVEGYQKFMVNKLSNDKIYRGHGIRINTTEVDRNSIYGDSIYMLNITFNNGATPYVLNLGSGDYHIVGDKVLGAPDGRIFNPYNDDSGKYYIKVAEKEGALVSDDDHNRYTYLYIGLITKKENNKAFPNPNIKIDLLKYNKLTKDISVIKTVYNGNDVQIPPRDLLLEGSTIYGINEGNQRGILIKMYADLSEFGSELVVSYDMDGSNYEFTRTLLGYGSEYKFLTDSDSATEVTNVKVSVGGLEIPIYSKASETKNEGDTQKLENGGITKTISI